MIVGTLDFEFFPIKETNVNNNRKYRLWIDYLIMILSLGSLIVQINYLVSTINLYNKIYSIHSKSGDLNVDNLLLQKKERKVKMNEFIRKSESR